MNSKLKEIFGPNFNISDIEFNPQANNHSILSIDSLENDKLFKALKQELNLYITEKKRSPDRQTLHKYKSQEWKENFYHSLQTLLNEVLFTSTLTMKKVLLDKILNWYIAKTGSSPVPETRHLRCHSSEGVYSEIYIPQKIESTKIEKKPVMTPYVPNKLQMGLDPQESQQSLFNVLLKAEESQPETCGLPKVKLNKNRVPNIRPYSQLKGSTFDQYPVIKDFRSTSRAKSTSMSRNQSPDSFRYTKFGLSFGENLNNGEYSAVPMMRRLQIKEVMKIKKRLASKRVVCPVKVLEGGLVISDYSQEPVLPERFPKGGELLMPDPFVKPKKTKKGKKKSKKK